MAPSEQLKALVFAAMADTLRHNPDQLEVGYIALEAAGSFKMYKLSPI